MYTWVDGEGEGSTTAWKAKIETFKFFIKFWSSKTFIPNKFPRENAVRSDYSGGAWGQRLGLNIINGWEAFVNDQIGENKSGI